MPKLPLPTDCCGCGSCVDACPKGALTLSEDKNCFYNIRVDAHRCIECKMCERQCHILHPENLHKSNPLNVQPLAAWSTQEDLIKYSATGAVFAQVAYNMLSEGNTYVYGAALQEDSSVKHIEISNISEVRLLQNSKYQQSYSVGVYALVRKRLKKGSRVLFSGVPCQIAALYSFLNYKESLTSNLYTIEVLCHGIPCNDIHRTSLKINNATKIYAYRNKDGRGWCGKNGNNNRLSYIDNNGNRFITTSYQKDSLFRSYLTFNFMRPNCYHCPYSDIHRVADLTIGDFWGWEKTPEPRKYENYWGTSIVLPNNEKGTQMMSGRNISKVFTTWREFLPINQNLYMPTNAYDYNGYRYLVHIKNLPVCIKNIIYQNGFFNPYFDRLFKLLINFFSRYKRKKAMIQMNIRSNEVLNYLEKKS